MIASPITLIIFQFSNCVLINITTSNKKKIALLDRYGKDMEQKVIKQWNK